MNFNWEQIYNAFEKLKDNKDFVEYFQERDTNGMILTTAPFDWQAAQQQISTLTTKYQHDLNWIAGLYGNGKMVTTQPVTKTVEQIWNDLNYIDTHIPLIALRRQCISEGKSKLLGL